MIKLLLNGRAANSCQLREEYRLYNLQVIENDKIGASTQIGSMMDTLSMVAFFLCK